MAQKYPSRTIFRFLMAACLLFTPVFSKANSIHLSPESEITLLTASPGDELYSVFGHSALRVFDPQNQLDLVFNYGTFDFDTPNFYMEFVRGKLLYKLSVAPMEYFIAEYRFDGRAIYEQVLNLTPEEKQAIFDFLLINQLPENAYYHYDFFYDNCATRIRDLAEEILQPIWFDYPGVLPEAMEALQQQLHNEFRYEPDFHTSRSLREMLQPFLRKIPWSAFGIDLALGLPADKTATPRDFMYLPDEMLIAFALASLPDGSPLVAEHRVLLPMTVPLAPKGFFTPIRVCWLLFFVALLCMLHPRASRIFDRVFFSLLGFTGMVILVLWFFTDHITTKINLNLLWAIPTHLYFIWVTGRGLQRRSVRLYFAIVSVISLLLLLLWPFIPQGFNAAFFPLTLISFIKSVLYAFPNAAFATVWKRTRSVRPMQA